MSTTTGKVFTVTERVIMDDHGHVQKAMVAEDAAALDATSSTPPAKRSRVSVQLEDKLPLHLSNAVAAYAEHNPVAGNFLLLNYNQYAHVDAADLKHDRGQVIIARNNGAYVTAATAFVVTLLKKTLVSNGDSAREELCLSEFHLRQAYESKSPLFVAATSLAEWTESTWYAPTAREAIAGAVQVGGFRAKSQLQIHLYKPVRQQPLVPTTPKLQTHEEKDYVYELHIGALCCDWIHKHLTKDTMLKMMRTPWFRAQVERYDALRQLLFGRHKNVACSSNHAGFSDKELVTLEVTKERIQKYLVPMIKELDLPLSVTRHA